MLISRNLHEKGNEVSIITRSPPASLSFKGQITKHTTVKRSIVVLVANYPLMSFFYHELIQLEYIMILLVFFSFQKLIVYFAWTFTQLFLNRLWTPTDQVNRWFLPVWSVLECFTTSPPNLLLNIIRQISVVPANSFQTCKVRTCS